MLVFVFLRKFCEIINFVFREIVLLFRKIFAKHEIEIWAKFFAKFEGKFAKRETFNKYIVTANTRGRFTRNSAPLWVRGQDAFLVIREIDLGPRQYLHVKLSGFKRQSFTFGDPDVI